MNTAAFRLIVGPPLRRPLSTWVTGGPSLPRSLGPLRAPAEGHCGFIPARKASRAFSTGGPQREAYTSFGNRQVPVDEKEKLVGGVFSSVAEKYDLMNDLMSLGIHRIWKDNFAELVNFPPLQKTGTSEAAGDPPQTADTFTILDLAGGTGDIAFRLIDRALHQLGRPSPRHPHQQQEQQPTSCSGVEVTVCDINADMLQVGMTRARERGLPVRPLVDTIGSGSSSSTTGSKNSILLPRPADFGYVGPLGLRWVKASGESLPFVDNCFDLITIAFGLRNFTSPAQGLREALRTLKPGGRFLCLEFSTVDNPILRPLYDAYSFAALPILGSVVAGDSGAYKYLAESIRRFPAQQELACMMQQQGFKYVSYTNMTCGVVAIHSGFKA